VRGAPESLAFEGDERPTAREEQLLAALSSVFGSPRSASHLQLLERFGAIPPLATPPARTQTNGSVPGSQDRYNEILQALLAVAVAVVSGGLGFLAATGISTLSSGSDYWLIVLSIPVFGTGLAASFAFGVDKRIESDIRRRLEEVQASLQQAIEEVPAPVGTEPLAAERDLADSRARQRGT